MVNKNKVSVVAAGQLGHLRESVQSLLQQSHPDWELILVSEQNESLVQLNDLRADMKVVKPIGDGIASHMNTGIGASSGDFIAFLSIGDVWTENKLSSQLEVFERFSNVALCYADLKGAVESESKKFGEFFACTDEHLNNSVARVFRARSEKRDLAALVFAENQCISPGTVMLSRRCIPYTGLFDPMLKYAAPCDMWIKIVRHFDAAKVKAEVISKSATAPEFHYASNDSLDDCGFEHGEIYSKYVQYGTASDNFELSAYAEALRSSLSEHLNRCHRL